MKAVIVLTRAYKTELFEQKCKTGISCISCSCFESLSFQSSDAIECQPPIQLTIDGVCWIWQILDMFGILLPFQFL